MNNEEVWIGCYCNMDESCHADYIIECLKKECRKRMIKKLLGKNTNVVS